MKERIGKVEFIVFDYLVQIVVTDDIVQSRNNRSHMIGHRLKEKGVTLGLHSYNEEHSNCYLFFTENADANVIAHECFHAIHRMFEWIEAKIEEEITAYHLGYLIGEVTKFVKKSKK